MTTFAIVSIVIACIAYYIVGWVLFWYIDCEGLADNWVGFGVICAFLGLQLIWIPISIIIINRYNQRKEENRFEIIIKKLDALKNDKRGIVFRDIDMGRRCYFNVPDEGIAGMIDIDIDTSDEKEIDKIVERLREWGNAQISKVARMKGYEESNL